MVTSDCGNTESRDSYFRGRGRGRGLVERGGEGVGGDSNGHWSNLSVVIWIPIESL